MQFSPLADRVGGGGGGMRDDSVEILFQSFLREAFVSSLWCRQGQNERRKQKHCDFNTGARAS